MSEPTLEASLEVPHSPEKVWALISDVTNMPRWSPQVRKTIVLGGASRPGATMINFNRRGYAWWPTHATIETFDAPNKIAFRVSENHTVWSFTLDPTEAGTLITQRREAPNGISGLSMVLQKVALGGRASFEEELVRGMNRTLQRVAADLG